MFVCDGTNVNDIYFYMTNLVRSNGDSGAVLHTRPSRYGDVIEFVRPVATVYAKPWECVLLDPGRNINPFFHFMEALWIMAGRDDVAFVTRYASRMGEFSDDGVRFHGAYGKRWRGHFYNELGDLDDQLEVCCAMLAANHEERRAVLTMWDPSADLGHGGKDIPCNTHVYLKVRQGKLIATVCCRSNDMVLGAYGTNAVQFAFLMAYVAARLGVEMGEMTQISDSLHIYTKPLNGTGWGNIPPAVPVEKYPGTRALCDAPECFIAECVEFCNGSIHPGEKLHWENSIFEDTAKPMRLAWDFWKKRDHVGALDQALYIAAPDWRLACVNWLRRAIDKREAAPIRSAVLGL